MDEGTFGEWLKRDGESVAPGDPLFTLESEKALQEIESVDGGVLHILTGGPQEGDTVKVGARIGWLLAAGEQPPEEGGAAEAAESGVSAPKTHDVQPAAPQRSHEPASPAGGRLKISPRAARVAAELGVEARTITGSGRDGRIREADVRAASGRGSAASGADAAVSKLSGLRRTIAERMSRSHRETAPVTLTTQADGEALVALRQRLKAGGSSSDTIPSYQDIIISELAAALREDSLLNSRWTDSGPVQPDGVHIGIAVDTPEGLLVPVIRHADRMHLRGLASATRDLIERARSRRCTGDELSGGTFTVTNLGGFGIDAFTPVINLPECAILGIGAIRRVPVVMDDGGISARHRLTLSLTFDHRIADGAPAARFLQSLVKRIEAVQE